MTTIRLGGSYADAAFYYWRNWRGQKWERQSFGTYWRSDYMSSWGPFDFIDMCNAAGIEPVITTAAEATMESTANPHPQQTGSPVLCCEPADMADLVEYMWGDPGMTELGKLRAADGHPEPYRAKYIELGNEQVS